ncbi:protein PF14_0175-like isoform X2 [Aricia agestis]|uniref:protein PF14_0175-like isoform X2 n=1 Tax=Aricia agestis TaxID=91739 RepID=UPI001C20ABCC|nr:protein PF14_0175-like isoform X2 [Aricia agestis]
MRPFRNGNDSSRGRNYPTNDGPLLQNELQNLDMELEILKRQREIIFKQRQVENQLFSQRLNTFNEHPSSSFGRPEPKSYSNNYSDNYNPSSSKSYKRPSDRSYDQPPPKQSRNDWADSKYKPKPLMNVTTQQFKKAKPFPNKPKGFEPRASTAPSFRPQKVPERTQVSPKDTAILAKKKVFTHEDVLRPGVQPNPSMNGRLELALGEILKRIKTSPQLTEDQRKRLMLSSSMRNVKSLVRKRIHDVMMNKQVRTKAEIEGVYKKKYKKDVDSEIIEAIEMTYAKAEHKKNVPIVIKNISGPETERIHKFFKSKINMLLKNKMQNMIDSLLKIHGDNEDEIFECLKDLPDLEKREEVDTSKDEADVEMTSGDAANKPQEDVVESAENENNTAVEDADKANNDATNVEAANETADNKTIDLTSEENGTEKPETDRKDEKRIKLKQYYKLMDLLIENRLPKLLLNFKDEFAKVMYCEKDFIVAKEMIMRELKETLRQSLYDANNIMTETNDADKSTNQESDALENTSEKETENNKADEQVNTQIVFKPTQGEQKTQMYVMLLGKPSLPAKALIYDFLSKFNPKSIKKHKTVNNLLVVGFESKDDYDRILKENETKVGDATFIIKANEVIASDKQKEKTADKTEEVNKEDKENETKETEPTNNDEVEETNDENVDKTEEVTENTGENKEKLDDSSQANDGNSTENNDVKETSDDTNDITEVTDKSDEVKEVENVDESNELKEVADENKEMASGNGEEKEEISKDVDMSEGGDQNKEVNNLETIQETEETDKAKARAKAVATPTRLSSRLANVTPSTIKTRRASRLAQ